MTWTLAQSWTKSEKGAGQTSATVTLGSTPTTGNLLVATLLWIDLVNSSAGSVTIKDANNVSFTLTASSPSAARPTTSGLIYIGYLQVPASPNGAITATFNTTGSGVATLWVAEYAPTSGTNGGLDSDGSGTGASGTAVNTPTLTVSQADDLCIAVALSDHQVSTVDSPWTSRAAGTGNQFSEGIGEILARGSNVAVAMTQNVSSGWDSIVASFKFTAAGGGGGSAVANFLTLLGVGA